MTWEGATLTLHVNGDDYNVDLSDTQFAVLVKILGLRVEHNGIACYSDETLERMKTLKGNPLRLVERRSPEHEAN